MNMEIKKIRNEYDEIKRMLNKIRQIRLINKANDYGILSEQLDDIDSSGENNIYDESDQNKKQDIFVINDVDVKIHSEDSEDLVLNDEEKQKISQLIDDFRKEVSELVEFGRLDIYDENAKLDGKIIDINLIFSLSTGNDTGLYISNPSMLKIDDNSSNIINKLRAFESKYVNTLNDLLINRRST